VSTAIVASVVRSSRVTGAPLPPVTLTAYGQVLSTYSPVSRLVVTAPPATGTERTSVTVS
jgi:hypothetical protein